MKSIIPALLLLLPLVSSHFTLDSPKARGFDEDKLGTFPCGGQDTVSANRIPWPLVGGPIQLTMEHDQTIVQVLLSLGNNPGSNFNIILQPTLQEQGIGQFCLGDVVVPTSLGIKSGDNATIQVVTNGDTSGGLYNCADITFQTSVPNLECKNGTGVKTTAYTGKANTNANGTTAFGASSPSGTATTSSASRSSAASTAGSGTAAPAATKSSVAAARSLERGVWGLMGVVLGGAVALV